MIAAALAFLRSIPGMLSPKGWMAVLALAAFLAFGAWCSHRAAQDVRDKQATEAAKLERKASSARETAASERLNDQASLNQQRKATDDALAPLPDAVPSDRRRARHCLRLPNGGADFPECRGPDRQAEAGR